MRRFLFSSSVISAVLSGVGLARQTLKGPRDWRTGLLWLSWLISIVLAVSSVLDRGRDEADEF
ncbi:MAG: hypothetical protein ACO39R_03285 [Pontimonas sp.]|nr:hypothetical protein [Gammaproteobacteria bacterium]